MASTLAPLPTSRHPTAARRFGYLVAIAVNGVLLWIVNQLLDWQWPGFLTEDFAQVVGLVSASFVVGMVVNAGFLVVDRGRPRALGDLANAAIGFAVSVRTWDVFPFDFAGYGTDWTWLFRLLLAVGILGTLVAIVVNIGRLVTGNAGPAAG
jgi:hypothetical protein